MKEELRIFLTTLKYYTRIPVPNSVQLSPEYLHKATRYFPFIGWIVGLCAALVFIGVKNVLPISIGVMAAIVVGIIITGAFHENGLARVCDAFSEGWTKPQILRILHQKKLNTYGVTGLFALLLCKFLALYELAVFNSSLVVFSLLAGHALSRFAASTLMYTHQYLDVNIPDETQAVPQHLSRLELIIAAGFGLMPLLLLMSVQNPYSLVLVLPVGLVLWAIGYYFNKWIGGYTSDCMAATQQFCEITFYLSVLILCKFL